MIRRIINNNQHCFQVVDNNPMIEDLKCSICLDIFDNPHVTNCHHSFCKKCIDDYMGTQRHKNCPLCREYISKMDISHFFFIEGLIAKMNVKCSQENCNEIFSINNIENHIKNDCNYYIRNCKFNCGKIIIKKDIHEHEIKCLKNPEVKIDCENCKKNIFAIEKNKHNKICPDKLFKCEFCDDIIKRKDMDNHFINAHGELILKKYRNQKKQIATFEQAKSLLFNNIYELKKYMETIVQEEIHRGFGKYGLYVNSSIFNVIKYKIDKLDQCTCGRCTRCTCDES